VRCVTAGSWPETIAPRHAKLPDELLWSWSVSIDGPAPRLAPVERRLLVTAGDGHVLEIGDSGDPAAWNSFTLPRGGFRPAVDSDPVFVTADGVVGRWSPVRGWRPSWRSGIHGAALDAFGLDGGRILLSSSEWRNGLRMLAEQAAEIVWSLTGFAPWLLALNGIAVGLQERRLEALDINRGRSLWQRSGVLRMAALTERAVWVVNDDGALLEVVLDSGGEGASVALPGAPTFALAPGGRLHAVGRPLQAVVLALESDDVVIQRRSYPSVRLRGAPQLAAVSSDGRLLVATADTLLALPLLGDATPADLWHTDELILDAQVHSGHVYVLTESDTGAPRLTCLAPDRVGG
jgi:hypothetical protein